MSEDGEKAVEAASAPEVSAAEAELGGEHHHLLVAYDRIRAKVLAAVERKGGKLGADAVKVLLLVPDIFLLLVRLTLDREVPAPTRALIGSVLAYFILPIDLFPEALVGGAGFLDDVVLATAVLAQAFGGDLEPYARRHWSGPEDLRVVLADVSAAAHRLLGGKTTGKLHRLLTRHGVEAKAEEPPQEPPG